jgi:hypothetical protein
MRMAVCDALTENTPLGVGKIACMHMQHYTVNSTSEALLNTAEYRIT